MKNFLEKILPRQGVYMAVGMNARGQMAHIGCETIDKLVDTITRFEKNGYTAFHACSSYLQGPYNDPERGRKVCRVRENWAYARSFWIDVDCGEAKAAEGKGYKTKRDACIALASFCQKYHLPKPTLVSSGYGVHAYFITNTDMTSERWVPIATGLKQLLANEGILADPSRTADFASILRPVGTMNRKRETPVPVEVLLWGVECDATKFEEAIKANCHSTLGAVPEVPAYLRNAEPGPVIDVDYPEYKCSAHLVADKCAQCRAVRDTKGDASYEHWRGVIGIIKHCEEGVELAREWTENRAATGHSNCDADTRYNTWESGPTTCAFFERENPQGCQGCEFKGKVATPLVLGRLEEETKHEPESAEEEPPLIPNGYAWNGQFMVRYTKNKDGVLEAHPFCKTYFHVLYPIVNEDSEYEFVIQWYHPLTKKAHQFNLPAEVIGTGGTALFKELGKYTLVPTTHKTAVIDMTSYLRDAIFSTIQKAEAVQTASCFGWQRDNTFVIGDRQYHPDGTMERVLLSGTALDKVSAFPDPKGTIEGYAGPLNWLYNREGMEPLQYAICSLWGSLLTPFCDVVYKGIPCVLSGASSGKGKTTSAIAGLYCFGDANQMMVASKDGATQNAMTRVLGAFQNLPILFDEMTSIPARDLSALAYSLANGVERQRLQSSGGVVKLARQEQWSSQCMMTGNTHMTAQLISNGNSEAEAMRLFEIRIDKYDIPALDPVEVAEHVNTLGAHMGTAGEAFIKYVVKNRRHLSERVRAYSKRPDFNAALLTDSKYRFYRYHVICTMIAAEIMRELGVIQFDLAKLHTFAMKAVEDLIKEVKNNAPNGIDLITQYLDEVSEHTITTPLYEGVLANSLTASMQPGFRGPLKVRRIISNGSQKDARYDNCIMVAVAPLQKWLSEQRSSDLDVLASQLKQAGVLKERGKLTLSRGFVDITGSQGRTWVLDYKALAPDLF